jgi:hypothetical protein
MKNFLKLTSVILLIQALAISNLFAQNYKLESSAQKEILKSVNLEEKDDRENIEEFDFNQLFADARKFYSASQNWKKIKCEPINGFICAKHTCQERKPSTHLVIDKVKEVVKRCEDKRCEEFPARFTQLGVYYEVEAGGPIGTDIRILGDSRYKEIVMVGLDAYISNGNCEIVN